MKLNSLPPKNAGFVEPMECLPISKLPQGTQWLWEIKRDGCRAIAVKTQNDVTLFPRRRKFLNRQFPYVVEALADLPASTVVDGRIARHRRKGKPDFNVLQNFGSAALEFNFTSSTY